MPEPQHLVDLRTRLARASRAAREHPDDPATRHALNTARESYATEIALHRLSISLDGVTLSAASRRRIAAAVLDGTAAP